MSDKNIIFMGTPLIAANYLNSLINNKYKVVSVFTQPPRKRNRGMKVQSSPVHELANHNNIKVNFPTRLDEEAFDLIKSYKPDLIIVMAYGLLIPTKILNFPQYGCINIHVSLLPRWRGASPIEHTLLNGDTETGITIIKLIEKLDAGPIIVQKKIPVVENINKDDLSDKLTEIGSDLLIDILPKLFADKIVMQDQNNKEATYAQKINSQMRKINFNLSTREVLNQIRAYATNPGAWFFYNNERIKIISASIQSNKGNSSTILNKQFELGCSDGSILPSYLQREGKKIMYIEDFLRGFSFTVGDSLNA
jgi:methionyl-tRNA formyltransferase